MSGLTVKDGLTWTLFPCFYFDITHEHFQCCRVWLTWCSSDAAQGDSAPGGADTNCVQMFVKLNRGLMQPGFNLLLMNLYWS